MVLIIQYIHSLHKPVQFVVLEKVINSLGFIKKRFSLN